MQFALLPEDDLNLAAVLRGPLLNFSEEQLMELAIGRDGSLWQSLTTRARKNSAFAAIADYLGRWLREADFITPFTLLAHMLNEPCPGSSISGRRALWARLGPDALDPIEELLNAAQDFSARHAPSLQAFLHWIMATETIIKREMDRAGRQVRIMTVHGAKGLEAPMFPARHDRRATRAECAEIAVEPEACPFTTATPKGRGGSGSGPKRGGNRWKNTAGFSMWR